ncbi:hypothetical protein GGI02_000073 [Coemansia sp. RSA 2322]|nr:hypothetical protein GGI02_000073 [Coemansia sp. RSA 2322]
MFYQPNDATLQQQLQQPSARPANKPIGMACRACRLRKIRCGGELPRCTYCVKKGYECVLTPHKKRGRPRKKTALQNHHPGEEEDEDEDDE